jgi:hypothetical protein
LLKIKDKNGSKTAFSVGIQIHAAESIEGLNIVLESEWKIKLVESKLRNEECCPMTIFS